MTPTFDALHYVTTSVTAKTPYAFATLDGSDRGSSTCQRRASEHAARICRETGKVVLFLDLERDKRWRLTPVSGRAQWTAAGEAA